MRVQQCSSIYKQFDDVIKQWLCKPNKSTIGGNLKTANNIITGLAYFLIGFLATAILLAAFGCGYRQSMRIGCHWDTQICDNLFGKDEYELQNQLNQNTKEINDIKKQLETMQTVLDMNIQDISLYQQQLTTLQSLVEILQVSSLNQSDTIVQLQEQINSLTERIDYQQVIVNNMQIELAQLAAEDTVLEYIYPCGKRNGYFDEILLHTKSGKYIAYFENGNKRFLTVLNDNASYTLTDGSNCTFNLQNGQILNAHR